METQLLRRGLHAAFALILALPTATMAEDGYWSQRSQSAAGFLDDSSWFDSFFDSASGGLKNMEFIDGLGCFDGSSLSFGGQLRHRYHDENNRLRPGGPGRSTYDLYRWRNWLDFRTGDSFRIHVEMIDASIFNNELPVTGIDKNRWDIQNAYIDLKIAELDGTPLVLRAGRQELLFGAQRLVSPLDFANTRRNFEGFQLTAKGDLWDVDAFATRPVNTATGRRSVAGQDDAFDTPDQSRTFSGVYGTYKGFDKSTLDLYWLWLREQEPLATRADGSRHTVGSRWAGSIPVLDACCEASRVYSWDLEGAYQFGHDNGETVRAGFFAIDLAHQWAKTAWKPKVKGVFYYTSGDKAANDGQNNTFDDLFPLGHAYWGLIDNLSGQNLLDYSVQAQVYPTEKLNLLAAVHWFDQSSANDFVYNVANAQFGTVAATGSRDIGSELDFVANYKASSHMSLQFIYSWFWYDTAVTQDPAITRGDASQFYLQTVLDY